MLYYEWRISDDKDCGESLTGSAGHSYNTYESTDQGATKCIH